MLPSREVSERDLRGTHERVRGPHTFKPVSIREAQQCLENMGPMDGSPALLDLDTEWSVVSFMRVC